MKRGFTDIHQHLVYGMDDGAQDLAMAVEMLKAARKDHIIEIIATPHVTPGRTDFDLDMYFERLDILRGICEKNQLGIKIFSGAELYYTEFSGRFLREQRVLSLAESDYALIEFLPTVEYDEIKEAVESILHSGFLPVLAHIERYECLVRQVKNVYELKKQYDVSLQVNCSTVIRNKGFWVKRFCKRVFGDQLIDALATDAHNVGSRPVCMTQAYQAVKQEYGVQYAAQLTGRTGSFVLGGE